MENNLFSFARALKVKSKNVSFSRMAYVFAYYRSLYLVFTLLNLPFNDEKLDTPAIKYLIKYAQSVIEGVN